VLADRWDADLAVRDMVRHQVTYSAGATVFLQELTEATRAAAVRPQLRIFACGGASIPKMVLERSEEQRIPAVRVYGMTELPTVTVMNRFRPFEVRAETDGIVAPGVEVRVVDDDRALQAGAEGELQVRGPERMLGYLDAASNLSALDDEGWFRTGDIGFVDQAGFLSVTGRLKDIINRGGEKFSAQEIEDLLVAHPDVRQAVVVPGHHPRLGEVPVAFLVTAERTPSVDELLRHLRTAGLAEQKIPTRWHFPDALPTTSSGKIKKFELVRAMEGQQ
jgi:acyl-CoA synthetase